MTRLNECGFKKQSGAAVMLFVFIIGLAVTTYILKNFNITQRKLDRQVHVMQELNSAKQTLLAWAVSKTENPATTANPVNLDILGQLPYPDRISDGNYDGFSDCPNSLSPFNVPGSYQLLIGKLPVYGQKNPCVGQQVGLALDNNDDLENRFWYAVSRNVVHHYEHLSTNALSNPVINPGIVYNPAHPWLRVVDENGNLLSDRVAAVIIAPGDNVGNQSRNGAAAADQFLDSFQRNGVIYANHDYDTADEDFVKGRHLANMDALDTSFAQPYLFNDLLVYITIDELISALNKRVAAESKWLLNAYNTKVGHFPNAADLSVATINNSGPYSAGAHGAGLLPVDVTDACQCVDAATCTCGFDVVNTVAVFRDSGTWNVSEDSGSCVSSSGGHLCTCSGAGSCSRTFAAAATMLSCQANGECTHNLPASPNNSFIFNLPTFLDTTNLNGACTTPITPPNPSIAVCNGAGDFQIGLREPAWFKHNQWQNFMYYEHNAGALQVGTQLNQHAMLIAMGPPITSELGILQARPSNNIVNYLDSAENTNGDSIFESVLKKTNATYNDEIYIVSP